MYGFTPANKWCVFPPVLKLKHEELWFPIENNCQDKKCRHFTNALKRLRIMFIGLYTNVQEDLQSNVFPFVCNWLSVVVHKE